MNTTIQSYHVMMNKTLHILSLILLLTGVTANTHAQTINGNIYGGGEMAQVDGSTIVTVNHGKLGADIFGGGEGKLLEYQSYLDVIGGGFNGTVQGNTNVHVGGNAMCRNVYGGGLYATIGTQGDADKGKTNVHITGGNIDNVYGGVLLRGKL